MQYKIIVDKQPSSNPSDEKKEYIIDIEELRVKGDVYDSLNIDKDKTCVTRRLSLSEYGVLSVLDEPVVEELTDVDIKLFEGDNYVYLFDMQGNKFYAEYLIKNDFNDIYATKNEMNSAITQTAESIESSVNQKLTSYATTDDLEEQVTELNSTITQTAQEINLEVSKKVDDEELTGANITLRINEDTSKATIDADKININGAISANGNFKVDTSGNMTCSNATFTGGKIELEADGQDSSKFRIASTDEEKEYFVTSEYMWLGAFQKSCSINTSLTNPVLQLTDRSYNSTRVASNGITTPKLTQTSLESIKKNINKFIKEATDIINNSDIYEYNLKSDKDSDKKMIGFIIGENYRTPAEVIEKNGQAVELYSAIGILWKAVQELSTRVEQLEKEVYHE